MADKGKALTLAPSGGKHGKATPRSLCRRFAARPEQAQIWSWDCLIEGGHSQRARIKMADKRRIEIFVSGGPVCEEVVQRVRERACDSCEVTVLDIRFQGGRPRPGAWDRNRPDHRH